MEYILSNTKSLFPAVSALSSAYPTLKFIIYVHIFITYVDREAHPVKCLKVPSTGIL